ncbi:MAG: MoaD/ThiS family protein [Thermodesulfobacteriota bacterium]
MPIIIQPIGIIRSHVMEQTWPWEPGMSASGLLKRLGIPEGLRAYVWLDGRRVRPDTLLKDGQVVRIVSALAGG